MDEVKIDINEVLTLLPTCHVNKKKHFRIHTTSSSEKISNLEKISSWRLYLKYCAHDMYYSLLQDSHFGKRKAVVLTKFHETIMDACVQISSGFPKQINLVGIDVFWSATPDGYLKLEFYVNTDKLVNNIEDSVKVLNQMCHNHVAPVINKFLFFQQTVPFLMQAEFYDIYNSFHSNNFRHFFNELEKMTKRWKISENYEVREDALKFKLMRYQKKTVKWMIERELRPEWIDLGKILECVKLTQPSTSNNNQSLYYFPVFGLFTESNIFHEMSAPKGGILADEKGLGKTVEILSLIVSHRKDEQVRIVQNKPTTSQPKESNSPQKQLNWPEYKDTKNGESLGRSTAIYTVTPEEWKTMKPGSCRKCGNCGSMCNLKRSGWKAEFEKEKVEFLCPRCLATETPLEVKTTLIVLPDSLIAQWYKDIAKHCSGDLKIMFYFGLNKNGYLHPLEIAKYDIILTTYSTLTSDMPFAEFQNGSQSRLKRIYKFTPTSITHVKWWRLIGDEPHLVEGSTNRAAQILTKIESHHRWCMTGTPIVKSISDLGGLFRIIGLWPFNIKHFWINHVVAEFHEMADQNKDLSNSRLFQIAGQIMRRNTEKMVEDEFRIPKLVEIEKIVQFTKVEESQYKKRVEGLRTSIEDAIKYLPDDTLLNSLSGKEKVIIYLGKLKETLISCGEHANFSKCRNANEQVMSDPKNVIFRLILAKKSEIDECLKSTIDALLNIAEIHWLKGEMVGTAKRYDLVADVFLMIEDLNKYFSQAMNLSVENMSDGQIDLDDKNNSLVGAPISSSNKSFCFPPAENKSKSFEHKNNRKRAHEQENENVPPQKIVKLEFQEEEDLDGDQVRLAAEQKAKKFMMELTKNAMRPILVDCLLMFRFFRNIELEFNCPEADEKRKAIIEKMGDRENMIKATKKKIDQYWDDEKNTLNNVKTKTRLLCNEWSQKAEQHVGMKDVIMKLEAFYESTNSEFLIEKIMSLEQTVPMLMKMSFWPVFKNSQQHLVDGEQKRTLPGFYENDLVRHEKYASCMGICNQKSFEEISRNYAISTSAEVLRKMLSFIDKVEVLRKEILHDYSILFDFCSAVPITDCKRLIPKAMIFCKHYKNENAKMCIDEISRNNEKRNSECKICSLLHTVAHLRFLIGTGTFHGQRINETENTVYLFYSMVFLVEERRDMQFDGTKELSDFCEYIERVRRTAVYIQSACDELINYNERMKKLCLSHHRLNVPLLRAMNIRVGHWPEDKLIAYYIDHYENFYNFLNDRLKTACQQLRYMIALYEKESNGKEKEYDADDNCCPICYSELEIVKHFPCGHRICETCYQELRVRKVNNKLPQCVTCRKSFRDVEVIESRRNVLATKNQEQNVIPGVTLAVKLEATIRLMKEIIEKDPKNNKILLFTTMDLEKRIWGFLTNVLQKANMPFVEVTRDDHGKRVSYFESSAECKILLCSLSMFANGLNLTQASHIIFLDPTDLFSVVEQGIGRVNRFGPKKEIEVYHIIVKGSIDEELRKIVRAAKHGREQGNELTVRELRQIFGINNQYLD